MNAKTTKVLVFVLLLVCITGFTLKVNRYGETMHNVDLSFNFLKDDVKVNNMFDQYEPGKSVSLLDLYLISMDEMRYLYLEIAAFSFIVGLCIMALINQNKDE